MILISKPTFIAILAWHVSCYIFTRRMCVLIMKNFHDVFFRSFFSTTEKIERLLRTILPQNILDLFDLSTLKIEPSVVVKDLEIRADLVLSIVIKSSREVRIILVVDHKSWSDRDVIQQLRKYQLVIVDEFCRDKGKIPSPVLCIIFYHGDKECTMPSSLHEDWISRGLFSREVFEKLSPYLMNFRPYVFDLSKYDIGKHAMDSMKSILHAFEDIWCLKKCKSREDRKIVLRKILSSVKKDLKYESKQYRIDVLSSIKQYFMKYDKQIDEGLFKEASKEVTEKLGGEDIMDEIDFTMEGMIRDKVQERFQKELQKRLQEEVQKKLQEEVQKERKEMTLKLLKADMSVEKVSEVTGFSKQEIRKFQEKAEK